MKKIASLVMAFVLLCLVGCGGKGGDVPMTASFADTEMTVDNMFIAEQSEYMSFILFTAKEAVTDVRVYAMEFADEGFVPAEELYAAEQMKKDETLLGGVVFWGDMTTYGISFTDRSGAVRSYELSVSGKDGSLVFAEVTDG